MKLLGDVVMAGLVRRPSGSAESVVVAQRIDSVSRSPAAACAASSAAFQPSPENAAWARSR
jgi:hypothetical protein